MPDSLRQFSVQHFSPSCGEQIVEPHLEIGLRYYVYSNSPRRRSVEVGGGIFGAEDDLTIRLFNREVLRTTVFAAEQFTPAELNGLLGSADALSIQWVATRGNGSNSVTVNIYESNDNQNWVLYTTLISATLTGNSLESGFLSESLTGTLARGAFVRLGIKMSSADADLVVTVTGRAI